MGDMDESVDWDIAFPDRKAGSFDLRRPVATLTFSDGRRQHIPVEVGQRLKKDQKEAEHPWGPDELAMAVERIELECAWQKAVSLLNRRDYTSREMHDRLVLRGYLEAVAQDTVERAEGRHLVDDTRYAKTFVETKIRAGWGRKKILLELKRRGIELPSGLSWSEASGDESEEQRAFELARRKHVSSGNEYQKLVRFLAGRGYGYELAGRVASQVLEERRAG